jgi:hypothetical protein
MADRRGPGARAEDVLHHRAEYAGQRPVLVAQQHAGALQRAALSAGDGLRQRPAAAPARDGEVRHLPNARYIPFPSIWGHFAGGPGTSPDDVKFLDGKLKELLAS